MTLFSSPNQESKNLRVRAELALYYTMMRPAPDLSPTDFRDLADVIGDMAPAEAADRGVALAHALAPAPVAVAKGECDPRQVTRAREVAPSRTSPIGRRRGAR